MNKINGIYDAIQPLKTTKRQMKRDTTIYPDKDCYKKQSWNDAPGMKGDRSRIERTGQED